MPLTFCEAEAAQSYWFITG